MGARLVTGSVAMRQQDIAADANKTTLTLRVNGAPFAVCTSEDGTHAEKFACDFLKAALTGDKGAGLMLAEAEQGATARPKKNAVYNIFLTRSPCQRCTERLLDLHNLLPHDREIRIFCATIYKGTNNGESRANIMRLRNAGVSVFFWNAREMARSGDSDSATLLAVASRISNWDSRDTSGGPGDHKLDSRFSGRSPDADLLEDYAGPLYLARLD